ncbi:hypothetical protein [Kitasatospora sp. NPDC088861]
MSAIVAVLAVLAVLAVVAVVAVMAAPPGMAGSGPDVSAGEVVVMC